VPDQTVSETEVSVPESTRAEPLRFLNWFVNTFVRLLLRVVELVPEANA
jgi:hypothetical protein